MAAHVKEDLRRTPGSLGEMTMEVEKSLETEEGMKGHEVEKEIGDDEAGRGDQRDGEVEAGKEKEKVGGTEQVLCLFVFVHNVVGMSTVYVNSQSASKAEVAGTILSISYGTLNKDVSCLRT